MYIDRENHAQSGQASVELVAVLPLIALIAGLCWQLLIAGQSIWLAGASASAAARTQAVSGERPKVLAAARSELPEYLRSGLRVSSPESDGSVTVDLDVPAVVGSGTLVTLHSTAQFAPQRGGK